MGGTSLELYSVTDLGHNTAVAVRLVDTKRSADWVVHVTEKRRISAQLVVMPTSPPEVDTFYTQLQQRIVDSGEWDRIRFVLASKLNEAGWSDDLRHRSKERAREMKPLSFQTLYDEISSIAPTSIPLAVKREILSQIRQWVDKQFA